MQDNVPPATSLCATWLSKNSAAVDTARTGVNDGYIMFRWLRIGSTRQRRGQQLYERIVAQARDASLYEECGVPDTMDGRLEMILLHTVLVLDRLRNEGAAAQRLGQRLMEHLVADVDDALRRIGLGDDSVSPRVGRLAGALAERARDYRRALDEDEKHSANEPATRSLEEALLDHVYRPSSPAAADELAPRAARLASYVRQLSKALAATSMSELGDGRFVSPVLGTPDASMREFRS